MIALVTGASRGGGRGIAVALGELGATVYVTGRTRAGEPGPDGLPGNIDETSDEVSARGGIGVPVRVDHTRADEVEALFARIREEQGRLDLLVANAWGGYEGEQNSFDAPFWEQPEWRFNRMLDAGLRATYLAAVRAARLMLPERRGLIIGTTLYTGPHDWSLEREGPIGVEYEAVKVAVNRLLFGMAHSLRPHGVAVVAVAPGWMRTEGALRHNPPPVDDPNAHSVEFLGRVIAALAADPHVLQRTGGIYRATDLAQSYGLALP
jgi:NAD(P)-dependent dehydrogenase (short-subunit alcohol dehydrogenase family)